MLDYHDGRPPQERAPLAAKSRNLYAYAIGVLLFLALIAGGLIWYTGTLDQNLPEIKPTARPAATAASAPTTTLPAQVKPTTPAAATATALPRRGFVKVTNTGGQGVNMRAEPSANAARVDVLTEGAILEVIGPDVQAEGRTWRSLKDKSGKTGWVAADFLQTTEP